MIHGLLQGLLVRTLGFFGECFGGLAQFVLLRFPAQLAREFAVALREAAEVKLLGPILRGAAGGFVGEPLLELLLLAQQLLHALQGIFEERTAGAGLLGILTRFGGLLLLQFLQLVEQRLFFGGGLGLQEFGGVLLQLFLALGEFACGLRLRRGGLALLVEDLHEQPLFLVANEFLDALPIRQFQHGPEGWRERLIGLRDEALAFGLSAPLGQVPDTLAFLDAPATALVEDNLPARQAVAGVATRIARHGGVAYWIDYGGWRSLGDTLQALRNHAFDDPLAHPGEADLTAHVDFEPLAALAPAFAYDTQGAVLSRLGIDVRAEQLAVKLTGAALESHRAAHRRLTHPEEMGSVFKVLAVTSAGSPPPPGFT